MNVGDEVICVDATPIEAGIYEIRLGATYWLTEVHTRCVRLKGLEGYYFTWRFVKLPKLTVDQEDEVTA